MPIGEAASDAAAEREAAEVVLRKRTQFGVRVNIYIYIYIYTYADRGGGFRCSG